MNIPYEKWHGAIKARHSRRQYKKQALEKRDIETLNSFIKELNASSDGVRTVLIPENKDDVFKGIVGSYGKINDTPSYAVFIGNEAAPNVEEKIGYMGECFVLEATSMGLGTCWVAGTLNKDKVTKQTGLKPGERIYSITPVGYIEDKYTFQEKLMSMFAQSHKRKNLDELCIVRNKESLPEWITTALECARLAPSAINRQPWRFIVENDNIKIMIDSKSDSEKSVSKRLDCGIAMLHLEVGAGYKGVKGSWTYLNTPDVAMFKLGKQ